MFRVFGKNILILKMGKNGFTHPKFFRPSSLASFLLTLNEVLNNYLRTTVQHSQHAFKSTETAIYQLIATKGEVNESKEMLISFDIERAFDDTLHVVIRNALKIRDI